MPARIHLEQAYRSNDLRASPILRSNDTRKKLNIKSKQELGSNNMCNLEVRISSKYPYHIECRLLE